jgi:hypothetical protein
MGPRSLLPRDGQYVAAHAACFVIDGIMLISRGLTDAFTAERALTWLQRNGDAVRFLTDLAPRTIARPHPARLGTAPPTTTNHLTIATSKCWDRARCRRPIDPSNHDGLVCVLSRLLRVVGCFLFFRVSHSPALPVPARTLGPRARTSLGFQNIWMETIFFVNTTFAHTPIPMILCVKGDHRDLREDRSDGWTQVKESTKIHLFDRFNA